MALLVVAGAGVGVALAGGQSVPSGGVGLRVSVMRSLRPLAGCVAEVRVRGGRMGVRAGLWSVGNGWLPVDDVLWFGVWVEGMLVVMWCSY